MQPTEYKAKIEGSLSFPFLDKPFIKYFNRRMPKCNTVLQSENDLFEPEIQPNSHGNC